MDYARGCTGKVRFERRGCAVRAKRRHPKYLKTNVYRCRECNGWHFGSAGKVVNRNEKRDKHREQIWQEDLAYPTT